MNLIPSVGGCFVLWALAAAPLLADEVYLKSGGKVTGKVVEEGDKVKVTKSGNITVTIPREQVDRIVYMKEEAEPKKPDAPPATAGAAKASEPKKVEGTFSLSGPGIKSWPSQGKVSLDYSPQGFDLLPNKNYFVEELIKAKHLFRTKDLSDTGIHGSDAVMLADQKTVVFLGMPALHTEGLRRVTIEGDPKTAPEYKGGRPASMMAATLDGAWVASCDENWASEISIWKGDQFDKPRTVRINPKGPLLALWCADEKTLVAIATDLVVRTVNLPEGKVGPERDLRKDGFQSFLYTPDKKRLVACGKDQVLVLDGRTLRTEREGRIPFEPTARWKMSASGRYLVAQDVAAGPAGNHVRAISLADLKEVAAWPPPNTFAPQLTDFECSPDDRYVAVCNQGAGFYLLSFPDLTLVGTGASVNEATNRIGILPDGKTILLTGRNCSVHRFTVDP